jgi:hypothetical protein
MIPSISMSPAPRWSACAFGLLLATTLAFSSARTSADGNVGAHASDLPLLGPPVLVSIGTGVPRGIALGDFNGDATLDLIATDSVADSVSICLGTGSGSFGPVARFATGGPPWGVAVADFDRDGNLDVVTANTNATASILRGDGAGHLILSNSYPTRPEAYAVVRVARLVGAWGDLLLGTRGVGILPGGGDGTFGPFLDLGSSSLLTDVQAVDIDGDRTCEIVVSTKFYCGESHGGGCSAPVPGNIVVRKDNGSATFPLATVLGELSLYSDYQGVYGADVDGDGDVDLVAAGAYGWWSFFGNGSGGFTSYQWSQGPGPSGPFLLGDLSNDGVVDAVAMNAASPNGLALAYLGTGQGRFAFHSASGSLGPSLMPSAQLGDLNGDGYLDLVQASLVTNGVQVFMNNGPDVLAVPTAPVRSRLSVTIPSNPSRSGVRARVFLPVKTQAVVQVVDVGGRVLRERSIAGDGWHTLDFGGDVGRTAGVYFVRATQQGASAAAKVMVVP